MSFALYLRYVGHAILRMCHSHIVDPEAQHSQGNLVGIFLILALQAPDLTGRHRCVFNVRPQNYDP